VTQSDYWYKNGLIYNLDVETFLDGNGDGVGDFIGLMSRLDHLERLGVTALWLLPFYPSPNRDNGYDVIDYYGIDPRHGDFGDFVEMCHEANGRGIRILIDLVINHTSDEHPWFQAARKDRRSPYRDFYIWSDEPFDTGKEPIFKGEEDSVWTWDDEAGQYYYHRFYHFEPDLNFANPRVREELRKIMGFWLQLGVHGFRLDAASHMIEDKAGLQPEDPHGVLVDIHRFSRLRRGGAVLLGEADVDADELGEFFGKGDELQLLLNFLLTNYIFLALARDSAEPVRRGLKLLPQRPKEGQWANFLRNHDELDLERLTEEERAEVMDRFAPEETMRIYDRGIRRRVAPMLDGDRDWMELAYSLLFAMPGIPLIRYGQEIGMGEDLSLDERNSVRTPMQWSRENNAGFSDADKKDLVAPVIKEGAFGYQKVNAADQHRDRESFLSWMQQLIRVRKSCPEIGWADPQILECGSEDVLVLRNEWDGGEVVTIHNLSRDERAVRIPLDPQDLERMEIILSPDGLPEWDQKTGEITMGGHGFLWIRVRTSKSHSGM